MKNNCLFFASHFSHFSQKKCRPGKGNGKKSKGQGKFTENILVSRSFIGDYAAVIEIHYFEAGNQYRVTAFTKDLELLKNENELKIFIGGIIAACKVRRKAA